mgnify:CR=1 FL=1
MTPKVVLSRREALARMGASSLFALGLWPGCHSPGATAGNGRRFRFLILNDLHHANAECNPWFEALTRRLRTHTDAEFALLLGDLADTAEPASHAAIRDHFKRIGKPVYTQVGNHDHKSAKDRTSYETHFPSQTNYWFEHRGWQFVGIDSTEGTSADKTRVQAPTLAWLDRYLPKTDPRKPTVLFTHFPMAAGVKMAPLNTDAVLDRFRDHNLRGVFSGHYHAYTQNNIRGIDVVTNRCCARIRGNHDGTKEKGYWIVTAEDGQATREFVEFNGAA